MTNQSLLQKQNNLLKIFKVLANANRLKIVKFIAEAGTNGCSVNQIVDGVGISQNNISNHLKLMRVGKILKARQSKSNMYYSINEPLVYDLIESITSASTYSKPTKQAAKPVIQQPSLFAI